VPSHLYSFSFEPNPEWSRVYAPQPEIRAYLERCADRYDLRRHLQLDTELTAIERDDDRWILHTSRGDRLTAELVVMATGGLSKPAIPSLPGIERFAGRRFHSATWDHGAPLDGARVAVVGTGASAIQFVPAIAPRVAQLHLFQRTPPWVLPRMDRAFTDDERRQFATQPLRRWAYRASIYARNELRSLAFGRDQRVLKWAQGIAKRHLARGVADPALQAKLTPDYTMGCKRILISDDYYPALARPNVEVVTDGIREVTATGVVTTDGSLRAVDTIIFGTGFAVHDYLGGIPVIGRGGRTLAEAWRGGAEAYLGTTVPGFPNLFAMTGPNTGLGHNSMVFMIESQAQYIRDCVRFMRRRGIATVEVRDDATRRFNDRLQARLAHTVWQEGGCRSWYLDEHGRNSSLWPGFTVEFWARTRRFDPAPYRLERRTAPAYAQRDVAVPLKLAANR
jgi:cation diffusion facilitator CzcD-associated flavoprotein CzcO